MSVTRRVLAVIALSVSLPLHAAAQVVEPLGGQFELAIGAQWLGPTSIGTRDATLTTGGGGTFNLFKTSSSFVGTGGFDARLGVRLRPRLDVEAFGSYARPAIETAITNDVENAPSTRASESVKQYAVGGGIVWYVPRIQSRRLRPFVIAAGAYVRQLHEGDTLAVNGGAVDLGGGVKYELYSRRVGRLHSAGLRADARLQTNVHGVTFTDGAHYRPVLTASAFLRY